MTCDLLRDKVMDSDAWLRRHDPHGSILYMKHCHPSIPMAWAICRCGTKHLFIDKSKFDNAEPYQEDKLR